MNKKREVVIYQAKNGAIELKGDLNQETIWASLNQIADIFGRDKSVISRHINNVFRDEELDRNLVVAKHATTANDGKQYQVAYYNLDFIISVGYRVNSKVATNKIHGGILQSASRSLALGGGGNHPLQHIP